MSYARDRRKKERRRALDQANPDRKRVRRLIRLGIYPRWRAVTKVFYLAPAKDRPHFGFTRNFKIIGFKSVFAELTRKDPET